MDVRITSPDILAYIEQLRRFDKRALQRVSAEALRQIRPTYRATLKNVVDETVSTESANSPRLRETISARVVNRPRAAPGALLLVGARLTARTDPKRPPAGLRLAFLRGTRERQTARGWKRGRVADRLIGDKVEERVGASTAATLRTSISYFVQRAIQFQG